MKKLIWWVLLVALCVCMLAGCNKSIGLGSYNFRKIHIDTYHYSGCLTVESWHEDDSGIEVKTKEAGSIFASEGTYILISGDKACPFCGG